MINDKNLVSDQFWTNYAAEMIYNSLDKHNKAVENLRVLITWAFGVFSTGGFFLTFFPKIATYSHYTLMGLGIAFAILTVGYYVATKALFPEAVTFNSNNPDSIKDAYKTAIASSKSKLEQASLITFFGFLALAFSILAQFFTYSPDVPIKKPGVTLLTVKSGLEKKDRDLFIPLTMGYNKDLPIDVVIRGYKKTPPFSDNDLKKSTLIASEIFYADTSGFCFRSFKVPNDSLMYFEIKARVALQPAGTGDQTVTTIVEKKLVK